jgi:hypothetical protein
VDVIALNTLIAHYMNKDQKELSDKIFKNNSWGFSSNKFRDGLIMVHCREDMDAVANAYRQGLRAGIKKERERNNTKQWTIMEKI